MGQHLGLVGSWAGWSCLRYHVRNVACVTGYHFSSFLPRVLLCRERLSQPVFMHNACHFICIHFVVTLFGSRPTSQFALVSFSFVHSDEKGAHWDYPCNYHLPDFFVSDDPEKRKNHYSFVGSCPVSAVFRHVPSTQKEHINIHSVVCVYCAQFSVRP